MVRMSLVDSNKLSLPYSQRRGMHGMQFINSFCFLTKKMYYTKNLIVGQAVPNQYNKYLLLEYDI